MSAFLKGLPSAENYDGDAMSDAEIERMESDVRKNILSHCVTATVANLQFDKAAAECNTNVDEDGLYIGTHHCVGRFCTQTSPADYAVELWAHVIPADEENAGDDYLEWTFGSPASGIEQTGPIAWCPLCGLYLDSLIRPRADG